MAAESKMGRVTLKKRLSLFAILATTVLLGAAALAQAPAQFSADMSIHSGRGEDMKGKLYFGGKKIRMDMDSRGRSISNITDLNAKKAYVLMNEQKMYMEHDLNGPMGPMGRGPRLPEFKEYDASNPCANQEGVTCKKTGTETVNGRSCDVWEFYKDGQKQSTAWVDQKLHIPVKTVHADGTSVELTNIKEGPQPASEFEVPSDYQKMDMGGMGGFRPPSQ